jgi:ABC-2 type transport system ATP-binding protein
VTRDPAIESVGLTKMFGELRAVDNLDIRVPRGSIYGLLGPNGAGKTTAIRMFATLVRPDRGRARVFGHDVVQEAAAVRRRLSLTSQFASIDEELTAFENLVLLARLLGLGRQGARARAHELLSAFGISDASKRQVMRLSGGMRRRLDLAASVVVVPDLLFLDEPTTGLDPRSRRELWDATRAVASDGTTVLLTTQYLDEADALADRIAVIDHGRVIAEGTPAELKASVGGRRLRVILGDVEQRTHARSMLEAQLEMPVDLDVDRATITARLPAASDDDEFTARAAGAVAALSHTGISITSFALGAPSLDEVFLALTGHATAADARERSHEHA